MDHSSAVNLSFTRFLFIIPRKDDDVGTRVRAAGATIARGFFNHFEAEPSRDGQPHETIQFLVADTPPAGAPGILAARYAVQVSGKYRPRLLGAWRHSRGSIARCGTPRAIPNGGTSARARCGGAGAS